MEALVIFFSLTSPSNNILQGHGGILLQVERTLHNTCRSSLDSHVSSGCHQERTALS